ncbi:Uncharacterized protein HZ326_26805, partial [Fusarium oxysporum f. sp. albedinis]
MDFGLNPEESSTDLLFVVCARCGEERPKSAFTAKRQSAGQTKQCIDCRNQRVSHIILIPASISPQPWPASVMGSYMGIKSALFI